MRLLTDQEVAQWCTHRNIELQGRKLEFIKPHECWIVIEMPATATERMILAGDLLLVGGIDESVSDLIWISTWRIWSDWNDDLGEFIVTKMRSQGGETQTLTKQSGHLLGLDERTLATALLWQTMLFNWDAYLVPETGEHIIGCSHDELVWVVSKTVATHERILRDLVHWKPKTRNFVVT